MAYDFDTFRLFGEALRLKTPPVMLLTISDILSTFGAFMAVMIAIEIFENLTVYLRRNVIAVELVMATALMAIARKVIILDYNKLSPEYVWGTAAIVLAMSLGYWLVKNRPDTTAVRSDEQDIAATRAREQR